MFEFFRKKSIAKPPKEQFITGRRITQVEDFEVTFYCNDEFSDFAITGIVFYGDAIYDPDWVSNDCVRVLEADGRMRNFMSLWKKDGVILLGDRLVKYIYFDYALITKRSARDIETKFKRFND